MGAQIKSMQRGNALVSGSTVVPLTTVVDPAKSIVFLDSVAVGNNADSIAGVSSLAASSLTLQVTTGSNNASWAVIELAGVKSITKGNVTFNSSAAVNVSGIDMSKAMVLLNYGAGTTILTGQQYQTCSVYFDYSTNTIKRRWTGSGDIYVYYQIVEFS